MLLFLESKMCVSSRLNACSSSKGSPGHTTLNVFQTFTWLICEKQRDLCKPGSLGSTDSPCQVEVRLQMFQILHRSPDSPSKACASKETLLLVAVCAGKWAWGRGLEATCYNVEVELAHFFLFMLYHSIQLVTCLYDRCLLSHVLCLRLWPGFVSCFPPVWPLPPFTPSTALAFRLMARLASTAFYFGLYLWVWGRGCSWVEPWEGRRQAWASGLSATCDVLSRLAVLGPRQGGEEEALGKQFRPCSTAALVWSQKWPGQGTLLWLVLPLRPPHFCYSWVQNLIIRVFVKTHPMLVRAGLSKAVACMYSRGYWPAAKLWGL